jgi:hypothetical protein
MVLYYGENNMEIKKIQNVIKGLEKIIDNDPSEEAFISGSDEYYQHAKMLLEPNLFGANIKEEVLDAYRENLEIDPESFINMIGYYISPQWGLFAKLVTQYGY